MNNSRSIFRGIVLGSAVLLTGCAAITNTETQQISVNIRDKGGLAVSGVDCVWKNSRGEGQFQAPAVVSVRRDYAAIHITCKKAGFADALDAFKSKATSAMVGNIFAGGPIGAMVDHASGTAYDYPSVVTLWFASQSNDIRQLPHAEIAPAVLHAELPPVASGFAKLEEVDAIPKLGARGRTLYQEWLTKPFPRAVAVSDKGAMARGYGPSAMQQAVQNCEKLFGNPCRLYAVDDQVVWRGQ